MNKKFLRWSPILAYLIITISVESSNGQKLDGEPVGKFRVVHKLVGGHLTHDADDIELITSGAGEGSQQTKKTKKKGDDEKKTLAQQVADGKYGLIQNEIFSKAPKKPGLISYHENTEVPEDDATNFGGLTKNDIWLSENHLLVIRGGAFPPHKKTHDDGHGVATWPPIDDFHAPRRPVKIPKNPQVPPPFPVQLTDDGPLLLLGTNSSTPFNGSFGEDVYPLYAPENFVPDDGADKESPRQNSSDAITGTGPFAIPQEPSKEDGVPDPAKNVSLSDGTVPLFPFFAVPVPPDAEQYDEDDPSIYYPPPYSFVYHTSNTSKVPAGPLVPGIILPPPPDFFAPLDEVQTTRRKPATVTAKPAVTIVTTAPRTTAMTQPTEKYTSSTPVTTVTTHNHITETSHKRKPPTITILKSITTSRPKQVRPFKVYGPPSTEKNRLTTQRVRYTSKIPARDRTKQTSIFTTQVPLRAYYSTEFDAAILLGKKPNRTRVKTYEPPPPAQYYFYEEDLNAVPKEQVHVPKEFYRPVDENLRYYYVNAPLRPARKSNTFSIHIARLRDELNFAQQQQNARAPRPVYQYSFESPSYHQRDPYAEPYYRENVQNQRRPPITTYHHNVDFQVTTPSPVYENSQEGKFYYRNTATENPFKYRESFSREPPTTKRSKPISQYYYESTPNPVFQQLYTKHDEQFIDDVTKQYFTVFGKKLPATTSIPFTEAPPVNEEYPPRDAQNQNPYSLERDTIVNYIRQQHHGINPDAEYVPGHRAPPDAEYVLGHRAPPATTIEQAILRHEIVEESSQGEIRPGSITTRRQLNDNGKAFVSYKLPGDEGTHFYFITPQLAQKRQQNASFYFSNARQGGGNA